MKKTFTLLAAAAALTGTFALAASHAGPHDGAIKARKAQMQLYAYNLGALGAMAKGEVEYTAEAASAAASNLAMLTKLDQSTMWPAESDSMSVDNSRALPDMWDNFPDVMAKGQALVTAAAAMETAAGQGLDELRAAMGAVGGACGGCHKVYRQPDN